MKNPEILKEEANNLFKNALYKEAVLLYDQCLSYPNLDDEMKLKLQNNKSQCFLNLESYENALSSSLQDTKALYRCAQAYDGLGNLKQALETVRKLIYSDPHNKAAKSLAYTLQSKLSAHIAEAESLSGRLNKMFTIIIDKNLCVDKLEQALNNITILAKESNSVCSTIWNHSNFLNIIGLTKHCNLKIIIACHRLIAQVIENNSERGRFIFEKLTSQYFVNLIYSRQSDLSLEGCRFLSTILDSLTQLKAYERVKEKFLSEKEVESKKVASVACPRYKLDPSVSSLVQLIFEQLVRSLNSYRLFAKTRNYILEILVRFVPSDKGVDLSTKIVEMEGAIECILEVASVCATTSLKNWRSKQIRQSNNVDGDGSNGFLSDGVRLQTTSDTRMIVACFLAKIWGDLSEKPSTKFTNICADFILDLLADNYLETKVEAASVIGTLFLGPYDVGSTIITRGGVLDGLLLLTNCSNKLYQTIALDTIVLATHKKQQCLNVVKKAVPLLLSLYKSEHDGTRIRALVALCKLGVAGGSDATIQSLSEGSNLLLLNACRRLLLGISQPDPNVEDIAAVKTNGVKLDDQGQLLVNDEESDDGDYDEEEDGLPKSKTIRKDRLTDAFTAVFKDPETVRWAIEGLAYLSINAEVKEDIVKDADLVSVLLMAAQHSQKDSAFALASVFANLVNAFERKAILPEMVELAKYAKQHIPEDHPFDAADYAKKRRSILIEANIGAALYQLTMRTATALVGFERGLAQLVSRLYLTCSELVEYRGKLVQAGAVKALLKLSSDLNTEEGKYFASQTLARLTITSDPRHTFTGQKSLDIVKPLLQLLNPECSAIQNFESLMALTNLASLDHVHRHRIMAENGLPLIDYYLFDDHEMLRRVAAECIANLAQSPGFVFSCGGSLPLDDADLTKKLKRLKTQTERIKLLVLYCAEFDDLKLVRAASGALATMSYDPGIIKKITDTSSWFEILQTLAGHSAPAFQHRAAHILQNFVLHGDRSLSEYMCKSNMLEVLISLSMFPEINLSDPLPVEEKTMNAELTEDQIYKQMQKDRQMTNVCAQNALQRLKEYNLVQSALTRS